MLLTSVRYSTRNLNETVKNTFVRKVITDTSGQLDQSKKEKVRQATVKDQNYVPPVSLVGVKGEGETFSIAKNIHAR